MLLIKHHKETNFRVITLVRLINISVKSWRSVLLAFIESANYIVLLMENVPCAHE
jgi:hypothetical protein